MVGVEAEQSGIIRAGARFVEAMATATVPKIVLTVNHASGAGYYAMAGQGFDPDFIFTLPTGRMAVMEGESAVMALFSAQLDKLKQQGKEPDEKLRAEMNRVRAEYERQLDARCAAARGFVDAVIAPEDARPALELALRTALNNPASSRAICFLTVDFEDKEYLPRISKNGPGRSKSAGLIEVFDLIYICGILIAFRSRRKHFD